MIALLTDFGNRDGFAGVVKGVLLSHCPRARIVDLSHEISPQDVTGAALVLASAVDYFPAGTVHLAVVDPGVGSQRRALAVETEDFVLVGPDNGVLSLAARRRSWRRIVHLDRAEAFLPRPSRTFHGRDVFAPVAAKIACGVAPGDLGTEVDDMVEISLPQPRRTDSVLEGEVVYIDRFGNLISNLRMEDLCDFRPEDLSVSIGGVQIVGISSHYAEVREGKPLALWNSWGHLEIAVRNGSAARHLRVRPGDRVEVRVRSRGR